MKVGYYPGCSLEASARNYELSIERVFHLLDMELVEPTGWTCCGSSSGHSIDADFSLALAGRNLTLASRDKLDLVVPCALCYNRLKHAQKAFEEGEIGTDKQGPETKVHIQDIASFLSSKEVLDRIRSRVTDALKGKKVITYYGCQVDRPPKVTGSKEYENPKSMDVLVEALGAEVVDWSFKTSCCGGGLAVARRDIVLALVGKLFKKMALTGAEIVAVSCQMCQANLDMYQKELLSQGVITRFIPILYITDLICLALGDREVAQYIGMNMVDAPGLLRNMGIAI